MKHSNDYWEQEAYWEMERRRAEKNRKTREQRRRERAEVCKAFRAGAATDEEGNG